MIRQIEKETLFLIASVLEGHHSAAAATRLLVAVSTYLSHRRFTVWIPKIATLNNKGNFIKFTQWK